MIYRNKIYFVISLISEIKNVMFRIRKVLFLVNFSQILYFLARGEIHPSPENIF